MAQASGFLLFGAGFANVLCGPVFSQLFDARARGLDAMPPFALVTASSLTGIAIFTQGIAELARRPSPASEAHAAAAQVATEVDGAVMTGAPLTPSDAKQAEGAPVGSQV